MKKRLIFANDVPKQFDRHKEYIKETLTDLFNHLDFDCKLKIEFVEQLKENQYEYTDCLVKNYSEKKFELLISHFLLNTINFDRGEFFLTALYHEFEHIRDYNKTIRTKLFNFTLSLRHQKNFERQYVSAGYFFWTEVYAYYETLVFAKENKFNYEKITFASLVQNYVKTIDENKKLYYKKDLSYEEGEEYINKVNSFIYLCAKYMGAIYASHSRIPYTRIEQKENYKKVFVILCELEPKIKRLKNNAYGTKFYDNLFRLGKYLCENLKWKKFKVGLIRKHGRVCEFY